MKIFNILSFFVFFFSFSQQKIQIIDSENRKPISQARVISNNEINYTNDDGYVIIDNQIKKIEISAFQYIQGIFDVKNIIELKPIYKEIDEVNLRPVDVKNILSKVIQFYEFNYETKPSIYYGTYKTKSKIDDKINRILVVDLDLWMLNNKYDYKKQIDEFLQINLKNKKYDKNRKLDKTYIFNKKNEISSQEIRMKAFLQRLSLFTQLSLMGYLSKDSKIIGQILNENNNLQTIKFKSENLKDDILFYDGIMEYDKKENIIKYIKINHFQKNATDKFLNTFNKEMSVSTNLFSVTYDMYKHKEKYVPGKITMNYEANIELDNKIYPVISTEEFVFRQHDYGNKKGLLKKIDLSKNFLENIIDNSEKTSKTLLSTEEQKFVNESQK